MKSHRKKYSIPSTIGMVIVVCIVMAPLYIMVVGAFKPNLSLIQAPVDLVPFKDFTLNNVKKVLAESEVFLWLKNSFIFSLAVACATIFISICAGYSFAKINFRGKTVFFSMVIATMMMPKQILMIPNYLVANKLHLQDTMAGVILTSIAPAFGIFLSRQAISSLPSELFDAAEIDGCGEVGKFFRVVVPLSMPTVGTIGILSFFSTFNDYIWQTIMISNKNLRTLPIGMSYFAQLQNNNKAAQLAMALIATVPLAVLFVLCQKFFIKGATAGAVKG